jgi:putative two-component system response regulator
VVNTDFDRTHEIRDRLLVAASDRLVDAQSLDDIIDIIRSSARGVLSADGVTFVLREGTKCHYCEEDAIAPLWKGQRFPMETCISGWSMIHAQTVAISDVFTDPRIPHGVYRETFVKSMIMTPIGSGTPVAAMGFYWAQVRNFTRHDVEAAQTLARAVAGAMWRAKAA